VAQALPIHIIDAIERRWQHRLDVQLQVKHGKNDGCNVELCPLCNAPASIEPVIPGNTVARHDYVCSGCGHTWRNEAQ
jgi:hypothetical protein